MPLETGTYVPDLVPANPADTDSEAQGAAHVRLVKATLKNTFPNFTDVALASTQAQLDAVASTYAAGTMVIGANSLTIGGSSGFQVPLGGILLWPLGTLPAGSNYWWGNGSAISRTTYAGLFAIYGTTFGAGDGSTTFNLPNYGELTLVAAKGMGGAASRGLWGSIFNPTNYATGGTETTTLTVAQMPSHAHSDAGHTHGDNGHSHGYSDPGHAHSALVEVGGGGGINPVFGALDGGALTSSSATTNAAGIGITIQTSYASIATNYANIQANGGGGAHSNVQPSVGIGVLVRIL